MEEIHLLRRLVILCYLKLQVVEVVPEIRVVHKEQDLEKPLNLVKRSFLYFNNDEVFMENMLIPDI